MVILSRIVSKIFFFDSLGLKKQKEKLTEQFDLLVIGFGKAGKTLVGRLSAAWKKFALIVGILLCLVELVSISVVFQPQTSW